MRCVTAICSMLTLTTASMIMTAQTAGTQTVRSRQSSVEFYAGNDGIFGLNAASHQAGFLYPRGSGRGYIFGAGLWFGAKKWIGGTLAKLTFMTYNPNSGASWATPGELDVAGDSGPLFNSLDFDRADGSSTAGDPLQWPLWFLPNAIVRPLEPGAFEPLNARRTGAGGFYGGPAFVRGADEQIVARFNDGDRSRYEIPAATEGFPLRLEITEIIYGFGNGPFGGSVVIGYTIVNRSSDTLYDCALGQVTDADLGTAANDHARFYSRRPDLRTMYFWTDDEPEPYGALAVTLLEAPLTDNDGFIDNNRRSSFLFEGTVGCAPRIENEGAPVTIAQRYDLMTSARFAQDDGAGDQRGLIAGNIFRMAPNDTAHFAVAYTVLPRVPEKGRTKDAGAGTLEVRADDLEETLAALIRAYYDESFDDVAGIRTTFERGDVSGLSVLPNPASGSAGIRFMLESPARITIEIHDALGHLMRRYEPGVLEAGPHEQFVDVAELASGPYLATVAGGGVRRTTRIMVVR